MFTWDKIVPFIDFLKTAEDDHRLDICLRKLFAYVQSFSFRSAAVLEKTVDQYK